MCVDAANGGRPSRSGPTSPTRRRSLALFEAALPRLGGLDILVNNAGILIEKPLLETTRGGLRPADRRQPPRRLPGRPRGAPRHAPPEAGPRHQHRLGARLSRPRELLGLLRLEGRRALADPLLGARVRAATSWSTRSPPGPTDTPMLGRRIHLARDAGRGIDEPARPDRAARGDRRGGGLPGRARARPS